ncbi:MAG: KamA family radical SAM protein [Spirochaetes bacterium]|nr:KamA family radical SAM protein [Spirochaetota bacterium]
MIQYNNSEILAKTKEELIELIWDADNHIKTILLNSWNITECRVRLLNYINNLENYYLNFFSKGKEQWHSVPKKNLAKISIKIIKNLIRKENEAIAEFSLLQTLLDLANNKKKAVELVSKGFLTEILYLLIGIHGKVILPSEDEKKGFLAKKGRDAAIFRSGQLDQYSQRIDRFYKKYKSGLDEEFINRKIQLKNKILKYFNASESDWEDFQWQMDHIISDKKSLQELVNLSQEELAGLEAAEKFNIPYQITPHYLSLFNEKGRSEEDRAIRAQVLPSKTYCENVDYNRKTEGNLDFMGERDTSPIDLITRRYPKILILKPYDSCPQICVYCQRNWEIKSLEDAGITSESVEDALKWIRENPSINEVLITGGDPLTLTNDFLDEFLSKVSAIDHVNRIRIGSRVLITVPCRIDEGLINVLEKYHQPGKREICMVTHFEHATEMTPETVEAIKMIKKLGINIYNQAVFTYYNSRRFELCQLRNIIKLCGVDPYYTFNTKGKEETIDYRVPISRLEQEMKEEARLLPGLVRTDEAVFNVPRIGKSHLRSWVDHEPIMILPSGERMYRFYPWDMDLSAIDSYIYTDISIYDYLYRMHQDGEDVDEYNSIWYYF